LYFKIIFIFFEDDFEVLKPLRGQSVTVDETLRLSIEVSDKDKNGVWYKNGVPVCPSETVKIQVYSFFIEFLQFNLFNFI
jgi:hypothetical protein